MTVTQASLDGAVEGARKDVATALVDLAIWAMANERAEIPGECIVHMPVPPGTWGEKRAWLARVADSWGTQVLKSPGYVRAEKRFGPVRLIAALRAPDGGLPSRDGLPVAR
jgi:hypothetical protein